jgi:hypothetical protein
MGESNLNYALEVGSHDSEPLNTADRFDFPCVLYLESHMYFSTAFCSGRSEFNAAEIKKKVLTFHFEKQLGIKYLRCIMQRRAQFGCLSLVKKNVGRLPTSRLRATGMDMVTAEMPECRTSMHLVRLGL